ncbi:putative cytochrome P450 [Septoria linicola]|nr:putative cytochrome P450 [Septoria linicola]
MLLFSFVPLAVAAIAYVLHLLLKAYSSTSPDVPGPSIARFTRLWEFYHAAYSEDSESVLQELHRKHGNVVRVAPNRYSITDPAAIQLVYGAGSKFCKSDFYSTFGGTNAHDRDKRRVQANFYANSTLLSYEPFVNQTNERFVHALDRLAQVGQPFDLFTWMQLYAFDVIGEFTFGRSFGLIECGYDKDNLLKTVDWLNNCWGGRIGLIPEWHILWKLAMKYIPSVHPLSVLYRVIGREVKDRFENATDPTHREDMMAKCIKSIGTGKMSKYSMQEIVAQNFGAGSDTTATALSSAIWFLAQNPRCLDKLRVELNEAVEAGNLSDPATFAQGQKLTYLKACIQEALRLHSPVGSTLYRVVPEGGATIAGKHFPAGTHVGVKPWVIHHMSEIWGADVLEFKPERWLGDTSAIDKAFFAFGGGARTCIGRHVSMLEMSKLLPSLIRRFEFMPAQDTGLEFKSGSFTKPTVRVTVKRRG